MKARWLIGCAAMLSVGASAMTPEKLAREVESGWTVTPPESLGETRVVHPHEIVLRQRLLPIGYARIDVDAIDGSSGKVMVAAGTELFQLRSNAGIIECAIENRQTTVADALFSIGKVRICLRDPDKSGKFSEYVHYAGSVRGLPSVNGRLPKELSPLARPIPYVKLDPYAAPKDLFIGMRYQGKAPLSGAPMFEMIFGRGDDIGRWDAAWAREAEGKGKMRDTGTVLLKGAEVVVTALYGDDATITVRKPFPTGVLSATQFTYNKFY